MPVVRTDGRLGGRAVDRCTVTWLPNFLAWVDYFIFLPLVLRWRTSRARASLSSYKRRFRTTKKMDRHITWNVMWRSDGFPISDWASLDVFAFLNSGCVTRCALAWPHILLNEIVFFLFFVCFFFFAWLCRTTFNPRQVLYCLRLFYNYLGDKRKTNKQTNNIKTRSYFMCNLSRSWYVKKAKTDRDLSAKHEGQWLVLQKSEL